MTVLDSSEMRDQVADLAELAELYRTYIGSYIDHVNLIDIFCLAPVLLAVADKHRYYIAGPPSILHISL